MKTTLSSLLLHPLFPPGKKFREKMTQGVTCICSRCNVTKKGYRRRWREREEYNEKKLGKEIWVDRRYNIICSLFLSPVHSSPFCGGQLGSTIWQQHPLLCKILFSRRRQKLLQSSLTRHWHRKLNYIQ